MTINGDAHPSEETFNFSTPRQVTVLAEDRAHETTYTVTVVEDNKYPDVKPGAWYYKYVHEASDAGIINGKPDGTFAPDDNATRAEFAVMVAKLLGADLTVPVNSYFDDVNETIWPEGKAAIAFGFEQGYLKGDGTGNFKPNATITRQEVASIMANALNIKSTTTSKYADDDKIAKWARSAVYSCKQYEVMVGADGGNFKPTNNLQRSEAATIIAKALDLTK